jgi:drug/metabolite transporter (DMT)-like permease
MTNRAWAAFTAMVLIWGVPYLLVKVAVDAGVSPAFLSLARVVIGFAFLLPVCSRSAIAALRGRIAWFAAFAVFEVVLPMPLTAFGEQRISSSLTAILIAASPLFVVGLAIRFAGEHVTRARLAGLGLGFAGVIALVGVGAVGTRELIGGGAVLAAAASYAVAPLILDRRLLDVDPRVTTWAVLGLSSLMIAPATAAKPPTSVPSLAASLAIVGLAVTSVAGLIVYTILIKEAGPSRGLVVTYVNPLVAVALGVATLGEHVSGTTIIGLTLILLGCWCSTGGRIPRVRSRRAPRRVPAPAAT